MQRQDRTALNVLAEKIATAFGVTPEEIHASERFEQMVYEMAKAEIRLEDMEIAHNASFTVNTAGRIVVTYRVPVKTEELATFYHRHFPETRPEFVYGMEQQKISFLAEPFVQKVLPTMKLWRTRPSCLSDNKIDYVDSTSMLLRTSLTTEFGSAIFITGSDSSLGEWKTAIRMNLNEKSQSWECKLPASLKDSEFKYLIGSFDLGEKAAVEKLKYADAGDNRMLVVYAPTVENRDLPNPAPSRPSGSGARC